MIRALIADDHPIMREGLKLFLICNLDIEVDEAASGAEAIEYIRSRDDVDIVILDISMPGMDGLETLRILKQEKPNLPVLILSAYSEDQYALRALRSGANGYLMKTSATEELVEAVQRIVEGGTYLSPSIAQRVTAQLGKTADLPLTISFRTVSSRLCGRLPLARPSPKLARSSI